MAQTQFGFQSGVNVGIGNGTNQFGNFTTKQPSVSNTKSNTYNSRYPGFDEEDMKKLENMVKDITDPKEKQDTMDQLYRAFYDTVQNEHKNKERNQLLNQQTYEVGNIQDTEQKKQAQTKLKLSELAQQVKETYNIDANANDGEVLNMFIEQTPNGQQLLEDYINNGNNELLYVGGLEQRPQQQMQPQGGGIKSLINKGVEDGILMDKETTAGNILDMLNVIGEGAEVTDNLVNKYIPTVTGEKSVNNLAEKINNLTDEQLAEYRKQYDKLVSEGKLKGYTTQVVGDNLVEQLWNSIFGKKSGKKYTDVEKGFTSWLIDQNANFGQYMIGANEDLKGITSPNVVKFLGNIPGSAIKTLTATIRGMTNPADTLIGLAKLIGTEEGHQALLQRYGSWDAIANTMNTDPVGFADDIASVANMAGGAISKVGKVTGMKGVQNFGNYVSTNIGSATDALAGKTVGNLYGAIDNKMINNTLGKQGKTNKLVSNAGKYLEATSNLGKGIEYGKEGLEALKETVGKPIANFTEELIDKTVGIDKEDRQFIRNNKELVNQYLDGEKTVDDALKTVEKAINDAQNENSKMGKEYESLRNSDEKAYTKGLKDDLSEKLNKKGIKVNANGDLEFDKFSKYNDSQKNALKKAWEIVKDAEGAEYLSADQILNLRQKFDDAINWDNKSLKGSAVDKDAEGLIKSFREALDTRAKTDIEGLKVLDEKYGESVAELKKIKKDWFNSDGTLKDNARSKLRNLTKAGNEEKLARLEAIVPGITDELKALDVGITVDKMTKNTVGQYVKGGLLGGGLYATLSNPGLGIPMAVVGILATPKNFVKLIENMPDIGEKIKLGEKLSNIEIQKLTDFASDLQNEAAKIYKEKDYK